MEFSNSVYTEIWAIIERLDEKEYKKIPENIKKAIKENRDLDYNFKLNEDGLLEEQELQEETRALLYILYRDYIATEEEKHNMIQKEIKEIKQTEHEKKTRYDTNVFSKKNDIE